MALDLLVDQLITARAGVREQDSRTKKSLRQAVPLCAPAVLRLCTEGNNGHERYVPGVSLLARIVELELAGSGVLIEQALDIAQASYGTSVGEAISAIAQAQWGFGSELKFRPIKELSRAQLERLFLLKGTVSGLADLLETSRRTAQRYLDLLHISHPLPLGQQRRRVSRKGQRSCDSAASRPR